MPVLATTLLVFPLGAASSRSACAGVLRPEPLCLPACYRGHLVEPSFLRSVRRSVLGFRMAGIMLAVLAKPFFFFCWAPLLCALFLRGGSSPCVLVFWRALCFRLSGLSAACLPCCSCVSAREWLSSCLFEKLLAFSLGAASSRSACAAVLRPATLCLLVC